MRRMNGGRRMYLISYDIASNRIRRRIAKILADYGRRIQYSVFECDIDARRYKALYRELSKETANMKDGNIRFYLLSEDAYQKTVTIGNASYITEELNSDVMFI